jgi:hypothetical protein
MKIDEAYKVMHNPKNREEQINSSLAFIINNDAHFESLRHTPNRLNTVAIIAFRENIQGYHAHVLRMALDELDATGFIHDHGDPYPSNSKY